MPLPICLIPRSCSLQPPHKKRSLGGDEAGLRLGELQAPEASGRPAAAVMDAHVVEWLSLAYSQLQDWLAKVQGLHPACAANIPAESAHLALGIFRCVQRAAAARLRRGSAGCPARPTLPFCQPSLLAAVRRAATGAATPNSSHRLFHPTYNARFRPRPPARPPAGSTPPPRS